MLLHLLTDAGETRLKQLYCCKLTLCKIDVLCKGRIDSQEILQSLCDLGVKISEEQAEKILKR